MSSIAKLYLNYLEKTLIVMILASLLFISISGYAYGRKGWVPATLSVIMLVFSLFVAAGRRRALDTHPEVKGKPFEEIRLFFLVVQEKVTKRIDFSSLDSQKQAAQRATSMGLLLVVGLVAIVTIWSSFSTSVQIAAAKRDSQQEGGLSQNQALANARPGGRPATFFNKEVTIEVIEVSEVGGAPKVTAVIRSEGHQEQRITGEGVGYATYYNGPVTFRVQIHEVQGSLVQFLVERLPDSAAK